MQNELYQMRRSESLSRLNLSCCFELLVPARFAHGLTESYMFCFWNKHSLQEYFRITTHFHVNVFFLLMIRLSRMKTVVYRPNRRSCVLYFFRWSCLKNSVQLNCSFLFFRLILFCQPLNF